MSYKPPVKLVGEDGNPFAVLGLAGRALKQAERQGKVASGTARLYYDEATAGNYEQLLKTTMKYCEVI